MERWIGDKENGICIRIEDSDGVLDEVIVYVSGKCVVHMEAMSDKLYWFGLYAGVHEAHMNIYSKNRKSYIVAEIEE